MKEVCVYIYIYMCVCVLVVVVVLVLVLVLVVVVVYNVQSPPFHHIMHSMVQYSAVVAYRTGVWEFVASALLPKLLHVGQ
jgi:hypothetical protein